MVVDKVLNTIVPGRAAREAKKVSENKLDEELRETFPTSDPLASTQPGSGVTGAEVKPLHPSPSQVAAGKKSMAYRITYQSLEHTLTDGEVNDVQQQILARLTNELGAVLRG